MTQIGKCDICRQRKVKCDERRPKCGQCLKKSRPCQYNYGRVPKFVDSRSRPGDAGDIHASAKIGRDQNNFADFYDNGDPWENAFDDGRMILSVKSVKEAKQGEGVFHTFKSVRVDKLADWDVEEPNSSWSVQKLGPSRQYANCLLHPPTSADEALCQRFISLIGTKPVQRNPSFLWGAWVTLVPQRIGTNAALDDATRCFVSASVAYRTQSEEGLTAARKQYSKALQSLQSILTSPDEDLRLSSETLAAVKLLVAFETFLGFRNNRWVAHSRGLVNLLVARGPNADADDMSRSVFYSSLNHDFVEAILNGTDSAFDSPEWLYFAPPDYLTECPAFTTVSKVIMQQMVRLPRLMRLVREVQRNPQDIDVGMEALGLAEKLYMSNLTAIIDAVVSEYTEWVPTEDSGLGMYYPESMELGTINVFEALIRYCYCRILIIGLCKTLNEAVPFSPVLSVAPFAAEELQNAELIVMSVQYAERQQDPFPLGALLIILPLQMAFGTWWRIQRGDANDGGEATSEWEKDRASFMKEWCLEKSNEMLRMWNGPGKSSRQLEVQMAALEGGPLMSWMQREVDPP